MLMAGAFAEISGQGYYGCVGVRGVLEHADYGWK